MKKITFGRSEDCDIVFEDKSISRHHGYLLVDGGRVSIVDDDSTNGVYVNGRRISGSVKLSPRDKVLLAKKVPFDWQPYAGFDETIINTDETSLCDATVYDHRGSSNSDDSALIRIPSKMEINQNHAEVYRNGEEGADWKVPFKRNVGDRVGNAVGSTLGCIISIILIMIFIAILTGLGFH